MIRNWAAILKGHLQTKREFNPGYLNRGYPVAKKKMRIASLFRPILCHWIFWTFCTFGGLKSIFRRTLIIFKMPFWGDMLVPWRVCPSLKRSSPVGTQRRKGFKLQLRTQKIANTSFFMGTWGYPMPTPPLLPGYWPSLSLNNQLNKALFPVGGGWPWDVTLRFPWLFKDFKKSSRLLLLHKLLGEGTYQNSGADKLIQTQPSAQTKPCKSCTQQTKTHKDTKVVIKEKVDFAKFYDFTKKTTFLPTVTKKVHQKKMTNKKKHRESVRGEMMLHHLTTAQVASSARRCWPMSP